MNIKALAATALVATTALFAGTPAPAEASQWRCGRVAGYNVCAIDRSTIDSLKIEWSDGDYTWLTIDCGRGTWESKGSYHLSKAESSRVAGAWCYG